MLKELSTTLQLGKRHLFTVEEYMTLDVPERTELLAGVIYDVSPRNEPHRKAVRVLVAALAKGLDERYVVQPGDAVAVPDWKGRDAPEIDVAVIANKVYRPGPTSPDAFAFIEVSHTTYVDDRNYKIPLYVRAGVPSWIVNIEKRRVEAYGTGDDLALPHGVVFAEGQSFQVCGVTIAVADLFDREVSE